MDLVALWIALWHSANAFTHITKAQSKTKPKNVEKHGIAWNFHTIGYRYSLKTADSQGIYIQQIKSGHDNALHLGFV